MKKELVFLGPPASGKGTQTDRLSKELNYPHVDTGSLLRKAIADGTEDGKTAKGYIEKGQLVPVEIVASIIKTRLKEADCANGFILDGFPRTLPQAEALEKIAKEVNRPIDTVINLDCDDKELIRRISGRRVCKSCGAPYHIDTMRPKVEGVCDICGGPLFQRADDNEEALKVRLTHYVNSTKPLLDFYEDRKLLSSFNSLVDSNVLFDEVAKFLEK